MKHFMNNRNYSIELGRVLSAFLVVVIHVPLIGGKYIYPLACCAVPIFYMITGYFVYDSSSAGLQTKLIKSIKKYWKLWMTYFLVLSSITLIAKIHYGNSLRWSIKDLYDLFFIYGNCAAAETIIVDDVIYGTSALWFLYGGVLSLGSAVIGLNMYDIDAIIVFLLVCSFSHLIRSVIKYRKI